MIILNYCIPAYDYREWDYLIKNHDVSMEYPPSELHLNIDVTKLTQNDIDWMKVNCKGQLIEIIPEIKKYNFEHHKIKDLKIKIQNIRPPKIMKKITKKK